MAKEINVLTNPREAESKKNKERALALWEQCVPDLTKRSVALQRKALDRIDKTLDECNAQQAAKVFATLYDRIGTLVGEQKADKGTTNNFYFSDISDEDATALMEKVLKRKADAEKIESVEVVDVVDVEATPCKTEDSQG